MGGLTGIKDALMKDAVVRSTTLRFARKASKKLWSAKKRAEQRERDHVRRNEWLAMWDAQRRLKQHKQQNQNQHKQHNDEDFEFLLEHYFD